MTPITLLTAIEDAKRFLKAAEIVTNVHGKSDDWHKNYMPSPSKHVAQVKRCSLDLTRALAEMRRSQ